MNSLKENVLKLRKDGLSINEITKTLGCSKSTVSYHINNNRMGGGSIKNFLYGISKEDVEKIKEYRNELKTYDEIYIVIVRYMII